MIEELNWDSLAMRRKASRLSTFQRVYNNEDCLHDLSSRLTMAPDERLRHVHAFRLQSITCRKMLANIHSYQEVFVNGMLCPKIFLVSRLWTTLHFSDLLF